MRKRRKSMSTSSKLTPIHPRARCSCPARVPYRRTLWHFSMFRQNASYIAGVGSVSWPICSRPPPGLFNFAPGLGYSITCSFVPEWISKSATQPDRDTIPYLGPVRGREDSLRRYCDNSSGHEAIDETIFGICILAGMGFWSRILLQFPVCLTKYPESATEIKWSQHA